MSFKDYANHILQKHCLAISLAVIKSKPENITLEDHIQQLRNMINDNEMEVDNLSIHSDDFLINETNDFDLINDNNEQNNDYLSQLNDENDYHIVYAVEINDIQDLDINTDKTQVPESRNEENYAVDHINEPKDVKLTNTQDSTNSFTILANFDVPKLLDETNKVGNNERSNLGNVKDISDNMTAIEKDVMSQILSKSKQEVLQTQQLEEIDVTQCLTDDDTTQCESQAISTNVDILTQEYSYNLRGEDQSSKFNEKPKLDKCTKLVVRFDDTNVNTVHHDNNVECKISKNRFETKPRKYSKKKIFEKPKLKHYRHTKEFKNIYKNVADIFNSKDKNNHSEYVEEKSIANTKALGTFEDVLEDPKDILSQNTTQDCTCETYYSQSQIKETIAIDHKYIYSNKINSKMKNKYDVIESATSKKKKNDITIVEDELIINSKKEKSDINHDDEILLPEIKFVKTLTEKANASENLKNTSEHPVVEAKETISRECLMTNFVIPTRSQKSHQNKEGCSKYIQDNSAISNALCPNNDKQNANYSESYANESMLYTDVDRLNKYVNTLNAENNKLCANVNLPKAQDSIMNTGCEIIDTVANKQYDKNNIKHIDKDLFSEDSEATIVSCSKDAFQKYTEPNQQPQIDSLGFPYHNKTKVVEISKNSTYLNNNSMNAIVSDQLNNVEDLQNIVLNANVNDENSENTSEIENHNCANFNYNFDSATEYTNDTEIEKHIDDPTGSCINSDDNLDLKELDDTEIEKIPFKIIEELNKVKTYLNRGHEKNLNVKGYSSDTGYRSDTSSKNSQKMSQALSSGLDQSAHSLFNYIIGSPLIGTNQEIIQEISEVLGQMVDKLHKEEIYPTFIDDILQTIQGMLLKIYQYTSDDNMLTYKDDTIHRAMLLNKSIHIQKYTIEKITDLLENLHKELTSNESYEIHNIDKIENICYIFHLLDIILLEHNKAKKKLSQNSQSLSQSTQNLSHKTQDEKMLRKSNIMDIWRKKWNPNYKENQSEGSQEKRCVIRNCSAVLNKLIVGCMEGYSLISYFALQCFNMIQT